MCTTHFPFHLCTHTVNHALLLELPHLAEAEAAVVVVDEVQRLRQRRHVLVAVVEHDEAERDIAQQIVARVDLANCLKVAQTLEISEHNFSFLNWMVEEWVGRNLRSEACFRACFQNGGAQKCTNARLELQRKNGLMARGITDTSQWKQRRRKRNSFLDDF